MKGTINVIEDLTFTTYLTPIPVSRHQEGPGQH